MIRTFVIASAVVGASLIGQLPTYGQGKGNGLNRGLSAASRGMSNGAMARSNGSVSRASGGPLRNGASMGRASGGLQRGNAAMGPTIEMPADSAGHDQALANQQSILSQRLDQADHLRSLSQSNGNDHLLDTADRMEANANRNFARQQSRLTAPATSTTGSPDGDSTPAAAQLGTANATATQPAARSAGRRGLWFRSR